MFDSIYFVKTLCVCVCVCARRYVEAYNSNTLYNNVTFCIKCPDYSLQPFDIDWCTLFVISIKIGTSVFHLYPLYFGALYSHLVNEMTHKWQNLQKWMVIWLAMMKNTSCTISGCICAHRQNCDTVTISDWLILLLLWISIITKWKVIRMLK